MPIGPPSAGGSGALAVPLPPPHYTQQQQSRQQQPLPTAHQQPLPTTHQQPLPTTHQQPLPTTHLQYMQQQPHQQQPRPSQPLETPSSPRHVTPSSPLLAPPSSPPCRPLTSDISYPSQPPSWEGTRPPPHVRCIHGRPLPAPAVRGRRSLQAESCVRACSRKYVLLCVVCGLLSLLLGGLYLLIYGLLRSHTSSLHYFQTMPTYVPAAVQMVTGVLVCSLARRRHRLPLLVRTCGALCLCCAVLCVVVTVSTTVLHMNRLQTLHECEYLPHASTCTCTTYTGLYEPGQEARRFVFSSVSSCAVIHGPLYACLRALFGLSVIGILVSIFSCMLVYQLLSHEKKKMYWEQLEARRRLLYRRPYTLPSPGVAAAAGESGGECDCCTDDYGFPTSSSTQETLYPYTVWDPLTERCWSSALLSPDRDQGGAGARSLLLQLHRPTCSSSGCVDESGSGVLLRPYLPRRPHHVPPSSRPLSDPGVALHHLQPYPPPPFPEAFLPMGYPGYLWGPPPPYSQPASTENIPGMSGGAGGMLSTHTSPLHGGDGAPLLLSPMPRPPTLADLIRGSAGPNSPSSQSPATSPTSHILSRPSRTRHKGRRDEVGDPREDDPDDALDGNNSLNLRRRGRGLPLGHVKSLGDVTEIKHDESLDVIYCESKELTSMDKMDDNVIHRDDGTEEVVTKHLKSVSDPKSVYSIGKVEPESEIYFADVSSCVSLRAEAEEVMYYSDPTSSGSQQYSLQHQLYHDMSNMASSVTSSHMYEQVRHINDEEDGGSHHTSDDTMIVHTSSSSEHSVAEDADNTENTYSVASQCAELSSASPMQTDTDAYSTYTPATPGLPATSSLLTTPSLRATSAHPSKPSIRAPSALPATPTATPSLPPNTASASNPTTLESPVLVSSESGFNEACSTSPASPSAELQLAATPNDNTGSFNDSSQNIKSSNKNNNNTRSIAITNLNMHLHPVHSPHHLHHPLHPVHQPHHQAYHHHLSHNLSSNDHIINGSATAATPTTSNPVNYNFSDHNYGHAELTEAISPVSYNDRKDGGDACSGSRVGDKRGHARKTSKKSSHTQGVNTDKARFETAPFLVSSTTSDVGGTRATDKRTTAVGEQQSVAVGCSIVVSPPIAKISKRYHHRHQTHHKHMPHQYPHHHHHHQVPPSSSSSCSSSPASPPPSALLPQEVSASDMNGNLPSRHDVHSEPASGVNSRAVISNKFTSDSSSGGGSAVLPNKNDKRNSGEAPLSPDKNRTLSCSVGNNAGGTSLQTVQGKKIRANLSLPLRQLALPSKTAKNNSSSKRNKSDNSSSVVQKMPARSSRNSETNSQQVKDSYSKNKIDRDDKQSSKSSSKAESRRRSLKELKAESQRDMWVLAQDKIDVRPGKKERRCRQEDPGKVPVSAGDATRASTAMRSPPCLDATTTARKASSVIDSGTIPDPAETLLASGLTSVKMESSLTSATGIPSADFGVISSQGESPEEAPVLASSSKSSSVHQMLHNLRSVNV